jgi:hypothetical protein
MSDEIEEYGLDERLMLPQGDPRLMPHSPRGPGSRQAAIDLLDFGAAAGARGLTRALVTKYFGRVQQSAVKATLESSAELLEMIDQINQAQLHEIAQKINQLPQFAPQQTGLRAWLGVGPNPNMPVPAFVSLDAVRQILASAIATTANR